MLGPNAWNAARAAEQRALPLAPSGDPAQRVVGSLALGVLGKCRHDRHHLARLQEWLARQQA